MIERPLAVAIVAPAFVYVPLWTALSRGTFRDEGLDVHIEFGGGTTHGVTERVLDGRSQIGIGTPEGVLLDTSCETIIVAGHANRAALSLVAQPRFRRIEDLRGASFGVASLREGTAYVLREILQRHGLGAGDYHIVEVGTHPVRWQALQAGTLDAALQLVPFNFMAEDAGFSVLADASDYVPSYAFTTINVRGDWAAANSEILEAFLRALARATSYIYDNASTGTPLAAEKTGVPPAYVARALQVFVERRVVARDLSLEPAALASVERALTHNGSAALRTYGTAVDLRYLTSANRARTATQ